MGEHGCVRSPSLTTVVPHLREGFPSTHEQDGWGTETEGRGRALGHARPRGLWERALVLTRPARLVQPPQVRSNGNKRATKTALISFSPKEGGFWWAAFTAQRGASEAAPFPVHAASCLLQFSSLDTQEGRTQTRPKQVSSWEVSGLCGHPGLVSHPRCMAPRASSLSHRLLAASVCWKTGHVLATFWAKTCKAMACPRGLSCPSVWPQLQPLSPATLVCLAQAYSCHESHKALPCVPNIPQVLGQPPPLLL